MIFGIKKRGWTLNKKTARQGKIMFMVIAFGMVSFFVLSMIGGVPAMFGGDERSYVKFNGNEVLNNNIAGYIAEQIKDLKNPYERQYSVMRIVQSLINQEVFITKAREQKLQPDLNGLIAYFQPKYDQEKRAYEAEKNEIFPYSFKSFVEQNEAQYQKEVTELSLRTANFIDEVSIAREYSFKNFFSQVEFVAVNYKDQLKDVNVDPAKLKEAYDKGKEMFLDSIETKILEFKTKEKAEKELEKARKNPEVQKISFKDAQPKVFKSSEIDQYYMIAAAAMGGVSEPFEINGKFAIAQIEKNNYIPFEKLKKEELNQLKESALAQEKEKLLKEYKENLTKKLESLKAEDNLSEIAKKEKWVYGKTLDFSIEADSNPKDSKTEKPIDLFPAKNKAFFKAAFQKEGTFSGILEWEDVLYRVKVVKITKPVFPIPAKKKEEIIQSLEQREKEGSYYDFLTDEIKAKETQFNWENINKLFGIEVGKQ